MNIRDFINNIITFDNVDDILDNYDTQSKKGFIFERLFDIVIKFGFCDIFNNVEYNHLIGNANTGKLKILKNLNKYLTENIISGNSGGCSDITLKNKNDKTYIFISSKYPKLTEDNEKQKSVKYYNIPEIIAFIDDNNSIYKKYDIYLLVPDKKKVLKKVKSVNNSSHYITKYMTETHILDKNDLNRYFLKFKKDIIKNKNENWQVLYVNQKEKLNLRFHQELITQKTSDLINKNNKSFLWGCKCRSGKTYMIGGIIIKQFDIKKKLNVLIITPVPTETIPQFTNDLFEKFGDFDNFKVHHISKSSMISKIETFENNIFVISKQLLQMHINDKTIMTIKNLKLDIIGFDENHFGGTTDLSKDILKSYSTKNTIKIYLTATFHKPLKEWDISQECQMFWDIEDEQICKSVLLDENNLIKLKEKHGNEYITKTIKYYEDLGMSLDDIFKCYEKMPNLHIITNMFDQQKYDHLKNLLNKENKMGFCFDSLFSLNKNKNIFQFTVQVQTILRYISGSQKEQDGEKTIFTRINRICSELETRIPFTQIWFLPSENINEISECLKILMANDSILKRYDVLCVNSKNTDLTKNINADIYNMEKIAKHNGQLGVILLAGNMLTLGITLNLCDVVILLNNSLSSDKVLQQMYRCMTEGINKKIGFVVDLNISRVLNTCVNYTIYKNEKNIDDKMKYLINNNLINIDVDMLLNKKINAEMIIQKLMDIWKEDPINNFMTLLKKLDDDYDKFDNSTQKLINKSFTKSMKDNKINLKLRLKDENDEIQELQSGKERTKNDSDCDESDSKQSNEEEKETQISFTKDVLPYIIPLVCILTLKNSNMDFVKMLNDIKDNPELLDTFDDQCLIWWNKKDLIDIIKDIISKYFNKTSNTYNISVQFKMSLQSLIDNPKELLELIAECLKPKDIEKKQFGEVFTPMTLVNEMLDKLPIEVWTNKNLKWLDPATGMGNYPIAIYLRLMKGLKDKIKDDKKRKKHILKNMLYMCELNKKNVLICNQIFDINNQYKLNIYEGDSLKLDYNEKFGIEQFDIIVGNPPYQETDGNLKSIGGTNLYTKFINKSFEILKNDGFLLFINPISWMGPSTNIQMGNNILQNIFLKYDLHMLNVNECKKYFNVGSTFCYYLIQKSINPNVITKVVSEFKKEIVKSEINFKNYHKLNFLPIHITENSIKLVNTVISKTNKLNIDRCRQLDTSNKSGKIHLQLKEDEKFKYITYHTTSKTYYSDIKLDIYDDIKILINMAGYLKPKIYKNCNITESKFYIKTETMEEAEIIIKILENNDIKLFLELCKYSGFNSRKVLESISFDDIN
jgi:hypothetical protein